MSEAEVYTFMTDVFKGLFVRDDIVLCPDTTASDVAGWDSHMQIEIIIATQERFGIKMSTKELDKLATVGDLVNLIVAKAAASR